MNASCTLSKFLLFGDVRVGNMFDVDIFEVRVGNDVLLVVGVLHVVRVYDVAERVLGEIVDVVFFVDALGGYIFWRNVYFLFREEVFDFEEEFAAAGETAVFPPLRPVAISHDSSPAPVSPLGCC